MIVGSSFFECSEIIKSKKKQTNEKSSPPFQVCQPLMADGTNCSNPINHGKYIEDFTCLGVGSSAKMLKEMRLSFPSGHSGFTFYAMIFLAVSIL